MRNIKQKIQNLISAGKIEIPIVLSEAQITAIGSQIPASETLTKESVESVLSGEVESHTHKLTVINRAQIRRMLR